MGRRVRGNFKALLQRLPETVRSELNAELGETGRMVLARARSLAPVYRGRPRKGRTAGTLRASLSAKVLERGLKLKVGIVGKPAAKKAYYARFVEFGHRIGYRGNRLQKQPNADMFIGSKVSGRARKIVILQRRRSIRQSGVKPRPFLYTFSREELYRPFQKLWSRAIQKAAQGAGQE